MAAAQPQAPVVIVSAEPSAHLRKTKQTSLIGTFAVPLDPAFALHFLQDKLKERMIQLNLDPLREATESGAEDILESYQENGLHS